MMESEVRDMTDEALINQTLRTGINELQAMVNKGHQVPMSEFAKLFIWAKERKEEIFAKELEKDKRDSYKVVEHTWCGVPMGEFEIPSLGIFKQNR
jgi:hypothetical protein